MAETRGVGALAGPRVLGRLTPELILRSPQFMNCVGQYELDMRGNRINVVENLGATEVRILMLRGGEFVGPASPWHSVRGRSRLCPLATLSPCPPLTPCRTSLTASTFRTMPLRDSRASPSSYASKSCTSTTTVSTRLAATWKVCLADGGRGVTADSLDHISHTFD